MTFYATSITLRRLGLAIAALFCAMTTSPILFATPVPAQAPKTVAQVNPNDEQAYSAFARGYKAALENAIAKGGDAARYARENPNALFDALKPERDIAVLAFVIKSGADVNVKNNPGYPDAMGGAALDLAKLELLIKAGAVAGKNGEAFTEKLGWVLMRPEKQYKYPEHPQNGAVQRIYSKDEVVRFLVNAGAKLVADSVTTKGNVLLATLPAEKEIIDFLISKGATINAPSCKPDIAPSKREIPCGPLLLAALSGRNDLGVALLHRDKKIWEQDKLALYFASRRGLGEFALALLKAGADPLAADIDGTTALMWARKFRNIALMDALVNAGAPSSKDLPKPTLDYLGPNKFNQLVGAIIEDVAAMDWPRLGLEASETPPTKLPFTFYGALDAPPSQQTSSVVCEAATALHLLSYKNTAGSINIGVCKSNIKRVQELVNQSRVAVKKIRDDFLKIENNSEVSELILPKLKWQEKTSPEEHQSYDFPLVVGGFMTIPMFVRINKSRTQAIIITLAAPELCFAKRIQTPICSDTSRALEEIADRVSQLEPAQ